MQKPRFGAHTLMRISPPLWMCSSTVSTHTPRAPVSALRLARPIADTCERISGGGECSPARPSFPDCCCVRDCGPSGRSRLAGLARAGDRPPGARRVPLARVEAAEGVTFAQQQLAPTRPLECGPEIFIRARITTEIDEDHLLDWVQSVVEAHGGVAAAVRKCPPN